MDPGGKDGRRAAFPGASFTAHGCCINHRDVRICTPVIVRGRTTYQDLRLCQQCSEFNDHRNDGSLFANNDERSGHRNQKRSYKKQVHPTAPALPAKAQPTQHHDTPFDNKGRCHYHKDVKLAVNNGEWKVLVDTCPMCRDEAITRSESSRPRKSKEHKYVARYDSDGFCVNHPDIKIAKKKVTGSWKITNECSKCTHKDDAGSVHSKDSRATSCSAKSNRSIRSRGSSRKSRGDDVSLVMQAGKATQGESHWSNVSSTKKSKRKPKGIKRFLLASIAM